MRAGLKELFTGPACTIEQLPIRLQEKVRAEENQAEKLISLVQLLVLIFFSSLYFIAPRAEGEMGFNYVPIALGFYAIFTSIRFYYSFTSHLSLVMVLLSAVVDIALVMGLLFSFHLQYNQHPAFYLKAPTLAYVFLFISLRALRYDPRILLFIGGIAASAWAFLVAYVLYTQDGMNRITRNYIEYLTSNKILVGAELDKFIIIIAVSLILALALQRSRRIMLLAIKEHSAVDDLSRYFPQEVAKSIVSADQELQAGDAQERQATVMFVDIRGFTKVAKNMSPTEILRVLACYQQLSLDVIKAHNGAVDKFLGDGIMATFGALAPSNSCCADALLAAQNLINKIDSNQQELQAAGWPGAFQIGVGVSVGTVALGVIGVDERREFTVIGDAVNRAAKYEAATKFSRASGLTDTTTYHRAQAQGLKIKLQNSNLRHIAGIEEYVDLISITSSHH
ncbi:adenylate/guanylate cyclase domain-containing protein [Polycladidibacter stylochi]|uniref:adenylate/guanylate cyclase domain-containing protein n=1 Tax=Polycladidibacter stylochi TaxID=1807766 RepID=UPI00083307AA|nr:adenylate/guanylate cyclase domain-containing protein [Pseudovibrio stylochi]